MINAKKELISKLENYDYNVEDIKCFKIRLNIFELGELNIKRDEEFSSSSEGDLLYYLDFNYNNGYGCQLIDGIILMNDGCWFEREEYDGSEWWTFRKPITYKDVENF